MTVKVKMLTDDLETIDEGDIISTSKKTAAEYVDRDIAEYVDDDASNDASKEENSGGGMRIKFLTDGAIYDKGEIKKISKKHLEEIKEELVEDEDFEIVKDDEGIPAGREKATAGKTAPWFDDDGSFISNVMAEELLAENEFITFNDTDKIYHYHNGVYHPDGEPRIKEMIQQRLQNETTTHRRRETLERIRELTYVDREATDQKPEYICVENGILNLLTGELEPHTPDRIFLSKVPYPYNPDAECPKFKQFLTEVVEDNDIPIIQEMFGYTLYRGYPIHKAMMLVGSGNNGKSVLLNVLKTMLGYENVASEALQTLSHNRFATISLLGKLANIFPDIPSTKLQQTGIFKIMVGGDEKISAEIKHVQDRVYFTNHAKLLFSCNEVPQTTDNTDAYYNRWIVILFPNTFNGDDADPHLLEKLTTQDELEGILAWGVEGIQRLLNQGSFSHSKTTEQVKELYRKLSNPIEAFAQDCLIEDFEAEANRSTIYRTFLEYCYEQGIDTVASNVFTRELPRYVRCVKKQRSDGERVWHWITLNDHWREQMEELDESITQRRLGQ